MPKKKAAAPTPLHDVRPVNARGAEYEAERLTGNRAQRGCLPGGTPQWVYEVQWKGTRWKNTYEPASCLLGWEKEMKKVDENVSIRRLLPKVNPATEANKAREVAAKKKSEEMLVRRVRLQRLQVRRARMGNSEGEEGEEDEVDADDDVNEGEEELTEQAIAAELAKLEEMLALLTRDGSVEAAAGIEIDAAVTRTRPADTPHKRGGRSRVWKAFNRDTDRCQLPHPTKPGQVCNGLPGKGTGTSGHINHLEKEHPDEWLHILKTGERKTSSQMIADALAAKTDQSKPALAEAESNELHRLVARWIAKCGRPQAITEDKELEELLARILELCKARYRYEFPTCETVRRHLKLLGAEGKGNARNFLLRCLRSGIKISLTGDLWSENGMGLFGIYAHGMPEFKMEKALIGLVACESEVSPRPRPRHATPRHDNALPCGFVL